MDKGVRGDPESEGSPKQTLGADVQKVDIRLKKGGQPSYGLGKPQSHT